MSAPRTSDSTETPGPEKREKPQVDLFDPLERLFRPKPRPRTFDGYHEGERRKRLE